MKNSRFPVLQRLAACMLLTACSMTVWSIACAADEAGMVKTARGTVTVERTGSRLPAAPGFKILSSDRVITGADSSVGITLRDNTMLSAGANSVLTLDKYAFNSTTHEGTLQASVQRGSLAVISGKLPKAAPDSVRFQTSSVTLGVRGTAFVIEAQPQEE